MSSDPNRPPCNRHVDSELAGYAPSAIRQALGQRPGRSMGAGAPIWKQLGCGTTETVRSGLVPITR